MDQRRENIPDSIGPYLIQEKISSGAYGDVYLAERKDNKLTVAIKIVNRQFLVEQDAFVALEQETRIQQSLDHPNIVKIYDILYSKEFVFIILEYCREGDLLETIQKGRLRSQRQVRLFFYQILKAVEYIHARKIAHLDLKPENILVFDDKTVKLADFGCCEAPPHKEYRCSRGTLYYAAPEILSCPARDNRPADIWSLGILFFSMLNSSLPFRPGDDEFVRKQIVNGEIILPPQMPIEVSQFIQSLCQTNPGDRPTIHEVMQSRLFNEFRLSDEHALAKQQQQQQKMMMQSPQALQTMSMQQIFAGSLNQRQRLVFGGSAINGSTTTRPANGNLNFPGKRRKSLVIKPVQSQTTVVPTNPPILKLKINTTKSVHTISHPSFA